MPQELTEEQLAALTEELKAGRKLRAIAVYREATGQGLKESKEAVEALERSLQEKFPEQFPASKRPGCSLIGGASCLAFGLLLFLLLDP